MVDISKKRRLLQRLAQRADRTPANWRLAIETAEQIRTICEEAELLIEQSENENAFTLLWLVADELMLHYAIIEETVQIYECLDNWAMVVADVIENMSITEEKRQLLRKQIDSWDCEDFDLQEPLEPLITILNNDKSS